VLQPEESYENEVDKSGTKLMADRAAAVHRPQRPKRHNEPRFGEEDDKARPKRPHDEEAAPGVKKA
jgi:hypothetical protein